MRIVIAEIAFVLCWASGFVSAEIALADAGPYTTLAIRLSLAAVLFVPWVVRDAMQMRPSGVARSLVEGATAQAVWLVCVYQSQDLGVRPGEVALITSLQPLLTAALAGWLAAEAVQRSQWLGLGLGLVGTWIVVAPNGVPELSLGHIVVLGAVFVMTAAVLARRRWPVQEHREISGQHGSRFGHLGLQFIGASAVILPLAWIMEGWAVSWTNSYALNMFWQVIVLSVGSYGLLWFLIDRTDAVRFSSLFYFTPVATLFMAHLILGDPVGLREALGFAVALSGVFLVRWSFPVWSGRHRVEP